jgi:antitoxin MazE
LSANTPDGILNAAAEGGERVRAKIEKWGDGLGLRVPAEVAESARLIDGAAVELTVVDGKLLITPIARDLTLEEMLELVTDENKHGLIDWGPAVGKESW